MKEIKISISQADLLGVYLKGFEFWQDSYGENVIILKVPLGSIQGLFQIYKPERKD